MTARLDFAGDVEDAGFPKVAALFGLAADQVDAAREELRAETAAEQASTAPEKG